MDGERLDAVSRAIASSWPRRGLLGAGAGALATAFLSSRTRTLHAHQATPAAAGATPMVDGEVAVRRNAKELSAAERETLVNAILAVKKKPSPWVPGLSVYDTFVLWHRDAFGCGVMAAHMGPAFLPWHRQFVLLFEQQLQAIEPSVTVPYWDWTVDRTADAYLWADDFMGGNGDPHADFTVTTGPFRQGQWEINVFDYGDTRQFPSLVREFGAGRFAPDLPTAEDVEVALSIPVYDAAPWNTTVATGRSFRNTLEGWQDCVSETCDPVDGMAPTCTGPHNLHNRVHLWVAGEFALAVQGGEESENATPAATSTPGDDLFGTMAANTSLNDPVFWLHHSNIDRIWNEWMRRHGEVYEPVSGAMLGQNLDDAMWPFTMIGMTITPRMSLSSRALGYSYDTDA